MQHKTLTLLSSCALALVALTVGTSPASAQVRMKTYSDGYAHYHYPEICSFSTKGGSGAISAPGYRERSKLGSVTVKCPKNEAFSEYSFSYGSGGPDGASIDDFTYEDIPADGRPHQFEIRRAPGSTDESYGIPWRTYWTNFKIVPSF